MTYGACVKGWKVDMSDMWNASSDSAADSISARRSGDPNSPRRAWWEEARP